jgi:hypothetical protein
LRLIFPGTNIEIVGVGGLDGSNDIYGFSMANAFLGMDLSEDSSKLETWYSQDDRKFRVAMEFTMGTFKLHTLTKLVIVICSII